MVMKELSWKAMLKDLEGARVEGGRYMGSFIVSLPDTIVCMEGEDMTDEEPTILRGERERAQAIANCDQEVPGFRFKLFYFILIRFILLSHMAMLQFTYHGGCTNCLPRRGRIQL